MSEQKVQQLLQLAMKSVKEGDKIKARQAFLATLKLDSSNEKAWLGLATTAQDNRERLTALKRVLQLNPANTTARTALEKLGVASEPSPPKSPPPAPVKAPPEANPFPSSPYSDQNPDDIRAVFKSRDQDFDEVDEDEDEDEPIESSSNARSIFDLPPPSLGGETGVPVPDPQVLDKISRQAEAKAIEYLESQFEFDNIEWVHKDKRRAGEGDIWKWRAQVFSIVLVVIILLVGVPGALLVSSPEGQKALFAPTWTISPTPTFTPSSTPGITPTPSPQPQETYTPTPIFDEIGRSGNSRIQPSKTPLYAPSGVVDPQILIAYELIEAGKYVEAFNILEDEKNSREAGYPWPYYLEARIDLLRNNPDEALKKIEEGETEAENNPETTRDLFVPMYSLAHGEITLYRAKQAQSENRTQDATRLFNEAEAQFNTAIDLDGSRLFDAYIALARLHVAKGEFDDAITVLNTAILGEVNRDFFSNISLRIEKAQVYMAKGDYYLAEQEANEALYFEPYSEAAYILQAQSTLAQNRPGLAIDYLQGYLLFYPGSILGFKLQGDAYVMEGKLDQALISYDRALTGDEEDPNYVKVLEARGDLYYSQRRFDLARDDYTALLDIRNDSAIRAKRMLVAYNFGDYDLAESDSQRLEGSGVVSNADLLLLQGQIQVDTARSTSNYQSALNKLLQAVGDGVSAQSRPIADEYLARTQYELGNYAEALASINRALGAGETGTRRYLKGLILQAQAEYVQARNEYEFVLAWSEIFPYSFRDDAQERYIEVQDLIANPPVEDEA